MRNEKPFLFLEKIKMKNEKEMNRTPKSLSNFFFLSCAGTGVHKEINIRSLA
jgi:hypothetical protein